MLLVACVGLVPSKAGADPASDPEAHARQSLLSQADATLERLLSLRPHDGIELPCRRVLDRDQLTTRLAAMIATELSPQQRLVTQRTLTALRILAPGQDFVAETLEMLEENIAGYYDTRDRCFYILADMPAEAQPMIMAHELFHAVQDQRWGLDRVRARGSERTDMGLARTALLEGDAVAMMLLDQAGLGTDLAAIPMVDALGSLIAGSGPPPESEVPHVMWQQLTMPYGAGFSFVLHLYREGGWPLVEEAYLRPPRSTEQLLDPARWLDPDEPVAVRFEALQEVRFKRDEDDIVGAFTLRAWWEQVVPEGAAPLLMVQAADGWDGDTLKRWVDSDAPGRNLVAWAVTHDTEEDASRSFGLMDAVQEAWWTGDEAVARGEAECEGASLCRLRTVSSDLGMSWVEQRGPTVLWLFDRDGEVPVDERSQRVPAMRARIWDSLTLEPYPVWMEEPAPSRWVEGGKEPLP
jgi:hypothetical protein